jgi:ferredoxin--NADP+ reductase
LTGQEAATYTTVVAYEHISKELYVANQIGALARPLRVAIVGAGPSGFYAAGALLQQKTVAVSIDLFERLPTPHGLVRYGVAPDHQKIKSVSKVFDRIAADPRIRFFGNVEFGRDLTHTDLRRHFDQIVYAVGAQTDRKLEIPGEELLGSLSATEFVAWYNGHPDYADLPVSLDCNSAVVVGVGNVALDVARILARSVDELAATDITDYALNTLAQSRIQDIHVLARRGPAQVKFSPLEIKEFADLACADVIVDPAELALDPYSAAGLAVDAEAQRNLEQLRAFAVSGATGKPRRVHFRFLVSPVEIIGEAGRVTAIRIEKNELHETADGLLHARGTGQYATIPAGLVLRSVGYKGTPLPGVAYDARRGTIPNKAGRLVHPETGEIIAGEYVVGWAKRGPTGVIGTNKADAAETIAQMLADVPALPANSQTEPALVDALLAERKLRYVTIEDWRTLDQHETASGAIRGKPRVKFVRIQEMLEALSTPWG